MDGTCSEGLRASERLSLVDIRSCFAAAGMAGMVLGRRNCSAVVFEMVAVGSVDAAGLDMLYMVAARLRWDTGDCCWGGAALGTPVRVEVPAAVEAEAVLQNCSTLLLPWQDSY
jgi:hypothetical protein